MDHQRHPQAAECGCVHLSSKQLERLTATCSLRIIGPCCLYVGHGHGCLIFSFSFSFLWLFALTFSKYWSGYKHLCPFRLIIWRGRSPAAPPKSPSLLFSICSHIQLFLLFFPNLSNSSFLISHLLTLSFFFLLFFSLTSFLPIPSF